MVHSSHEARHACQPKALANAWMVPADSVSERRSEPRQTVTGEVLFFIESDACRVEGTLLDVSDSGFRAVHDHVTLSRGTIVRFEHRFTIGRAKVVWNRVLDGEVQSGFSVLREQPERDTP